MSHWKTEYLSKIKGLRSFTNLKIINLLDWLKWEYQEVHVLTNLLNYPNFLGIFDPYVYIFLLYCRQSNH